MLLALIWYAFFHVIGMYSIFAQKIELRNNDESELLIVIFGFIALYVLAFLTYYFIEKPSSSYIRNNNGSFQMNTRVIREYDTETVNTEIIL